MRCCSKNVYSSVVIHTTREVPKFNTQIPSLEIGAYLEFGI